MVKQEADHTVAETGKQTPEPTQAHTNSNMCTCSNTNIVLHIASFRFFLCLPIYFNFKIKDIYCALYLPNRHFRSILPVHTLFYLALF